MDISTTYLGLKLRSPVVASASPLSATVSGASALADAGVGAIVLYSLFEEQLTLSQGQLAQFLSEGVGYAKTLAQMAESDRLRVTPLAYLRHLNAVRSKVDVPVIASINGSPHLRYAHYAKLLEQAGADAIELNLYFVTTDLDESGADIERRYLDSVRAVVEQVSIPVAVKMSPYFSNVANMSKQIVEAGAKGLVLFNRFYQPEIDIQSRQVRPTLRFSTPESSRLPIRWISILHGRVNADLALTTGVHQATEVIKSILAGAQVAMVCGVLMKLGVAHVTTINERLRIWMAGENITQLDEVRGAMSRERHDDPAAYERAQYIRVLNAGYESSTSAS